jgi:prepilin-type N-terminal cleavage/methylation domain-containing protein/prepilin-type processing-associated H-X9-DG protein
MEKRNNFSRPLHGFTLVELLVVIAIIGVLVGLLLPAIQAARESARRSQCLNNLKQQGLALQTHHDALRRYPTGRSTMNPYGVSWAFQLLPFMELNSIHNARDPKKRVDDGANATAMRSPVESFFCPSRRSPVADRDFDNDDQPTLTPGVAAGGDYAANAGHDLMVGFDGVTREPLANLNPATTGPLFTYSLVRDRQVTDGLSTTFSIGERHLVEDPGDVPDNMLHYYQGDMAFFASDNPNTVLRESREGLPENPQNPSRNVFGSEHASISHFAFLDGHVRALKHGIDLELFKRLSAIGDDQIVDESQL